MKKIKVFLVDDHPIVREGVRSYLAAQNSITVVGEASDGKKAMAKVRKASPDVIILDISLPSMDGGELARRLRQIMPRLYIIAFSVHAGEEFVVRMARCGAHGYVMKDRPLSELVKAIKHVFAGGLYFPSDMTDALFAPESKIPAADQGSVVLTAREREVLAMLAQGLANKVIAQKLGISVRTVEAHRDHLSHKLDIHTTAGLTKYAIQNGLTSLK